MDLLSLYTLSESCSFLILFTKLKQNASKKLSFRVQSETVTKGLPLWALASSFYLKENFTPPLSQMLNIGLTYLYFCLFNFSHKSSILFTD